jgi:hypothetical protein
MSREPFQFSAAGSVVNKFGFPLPIDFDCVFPLGPCKESDKKAGDANCTKPHPKIALSTKFKKFSLGNNDFGITLDGLELSGEYSGGEFKIKILFKTADIKVFGKTITMNNGGLDYSKEKTVIDIPQIVLSFITLPPARLTLTNVTIDFTTAIPFRGNQIGVEINYNRTNGDVKGTITATNLTFGFTVKKGSFVIGSVMMTPRSLGIEYSKQTKSVAFLAEVHLKITLLSLSITFDPVKLYLSKKKIEISARVTNFEVYGAKPKIDLNMSYSQADGADASLAVSMTSSDVKKNLHGYFDVQCQVDFRRLSSNQPH